MDLILWRHAEAEDGVPDIARALTAKGHKQAAHMARWLREHLPKDTRILVSPATRAQQTAEALTHEFETQPAIAPGASFAAVLATVRWPEGRGTVLVVGHQPTLGQVAAMLLCGQPSDWVIKKGGIIWLTHRLRGEDEQVALRAAASPDLL
jgi:phosphohistidine phosphatase